jgi:hypothetical protein
MIPIDRLRKADWLSIFIRTMNAKGSAMTACANRLDLSLRKDAMLRLHDAADVQIVCRNGTVWITLDGDLRDIVLEAGDRFAGAEHRHAVVMALAHSSISVCTEAAPAPSLRERNRRRPGLVFEQVLA